MQQIKCARSLLTCWPPAVQSFPYATSIIYRNNKDWDFNGDPTSPLINPQQGRPFVQGYNQSKREYGMRTVVYCNPKDALSSLKRIQKWEQPILYDGSAEKDIKVLANKNLFLLFSKLNIPDPVIHSLKPVHGKLQEHHKRYVIVWIPVEYKEWDQKTFEDNSRKMPWYTINCFPPSKVIIKSDWKFRGNPMLRVMNDNGTKELENTDVLQLIKEKGVDELITILKASYN